MVTPVLWWANWLRLLTSDASARSLNQSRCRDGIEKRPISCFRQDPRPRIVLSASTQVGVASALLGLGASACWPKTEAVDLVGSVREHCAKHRAASMP